MSHPAVTITATSLGTKYVLDAEAVTLIRKTLGGGGLVVYPTDTAYGLAADPFQLAAIDRVYVAKRRPRDQPVSISVAQVSDIFRYGERTPIAEAFAGKNLPGPFTVILRAAPAAPRAIVGADGRIALRVPDHPIARLLAKSYGPITSTSANVHGKPSATTCEEAREQLADRVDVYVDGGPTPLGGDSAVIDLSGGVAKVLRQGVVSTKG